MAGKVASGGGGKRGSYGTNAEPNVIPFIDILLVLLIIFMVAAPIPTVDVRVDLPLDTPPVRIQDKEPTFVGIEDEGGGRFSVYVDGQLTEFDQLGARVAERALINNPRASNVRIEASIFLRADLDTRYENVFAVMNVLQDEGFIKVAIVAEDALAG